MVVILQAHAGRESTRADSAEAEVASRSQGATAGPAGPGWCPGDAYP